LALRQEILPAYLTPREGALADRTEGVNNNWCELFLQFDSDARAAADHDDGLPGKIRLTLHATGFGCRTHDPSKESVIECSPAGAHANR